MNNYNRTQKQFERILDSYFEGVLLDNPIMANELGIRGGEGKLGNV